MVFCFVQNSFFGQHELEYFFCRAKREIIFQNLSLGYITKTLNQIIFFSSTKIRIFFLEKKTYECVMERSSFFSVYIRNFIYILRKLTSSITGVIKQIQILRKSGTPRPIIKLTSLENLSVPRSI
jgi:hypothetical protein